MSTVLHSAPRFGLPDGLGTQTEFGEAILEARRDDIASVLQTLRDEHEFQQLMEIAGIDYPDRAERFEVAYCLLSLTKNQRLIVKCSAAEDTPVPTVTHLWPVAGWLEREVFDMYGVVFAGNTDLRRILTDYGFEGHPQRKDFPLTGYQELRYSEEDQRVVYEPVSLPQDLRTFDFMSPWEGADYVLPGDEKAAEAPPTPPVAVPKTTDKPADTGAGIAANGEAKKKRSAGSPAQSRTKKVEPKAPAPTESRPARKPRKTGTAKPAAAPEGS
ncbi:MAG: NADH-quinone oxidoreductase subunit C [Novosphingobium sp.]